MEPEAGVLHTSQARRMLSRLVRLRLFVRTAVVPKRRPLELQLFLVRTKFLVNEPFTFSEVSIDHGPMVCANDDDDDDKSDSRSC